MISPRTPATDLADRRIRIVLVASAIALVASVPAVARDDACLLCHDDPFPAAAGLMHTDLDCVACHEDLAENDPEDMHDEVERPRCARCHARQVEQHDESLHGVAARRGDELAPSCADCHGSHEMRAHSDARSPTAVMNIPVLCGRCHHEGTEVSLAHDIHQDRILENYSQSIHGYGLFKQGLTVTAVCTSCHTSHTILRHTDPRSSIHRDNVAATCAACHGQIEAVHRKVIEGRLWEEEPHKIPACVDCHSPHEIREVFYPAGQANKDCMACHDDVDLFMERNGKRISLYVQAEAYNAAAHASIACAQCHSEVTATSVTRGCATIRSKVDCSVCHADQVAQFESSVHGALFAQGDPDAPHCLDCHDKHATQSKSLPSSSTFTRNVPDLCGTCHREGEKAAVRIDRADADIVTSYTDSIHGKGLLESGLLVTPTCVDCHSSHAELPASDPRSSVYSANVADTCGNCHYGIEEKYKTSVHWPGNVETDRELPTCDGCHTSHSISRTDLGNFRLRMMHQCGRCHQKEAETFFDTFHGKVSRLGAARVAKCHDCHGTHDILPPSNAASTLSRGNVVETCGQCHEGAHRRFAGYLTHSTHHDPDKYPWLFWSFWGMMVLLIGTLTLSFLHTAAWLVRLWLGREEWRAHKALARSARGKFYRRFDRLHRVHHLVMAVSFFTLALTGMALKFSYMAWAQWVSWLLGGFESMGFLHRLGAAALVVVFALHLWDVRRRKKREGKTWLDVVTGPDSIVFNLRDLKELRESIRWFFGMGPRPRYGRYTYWEKFDYFAVFWGILVIGGSGAILWFPEIFTYILPGQAVNVATIIHSDEALLAVGFIFTIHFFNTHFRPDKFPIDPVIFTGRVALDEFKYDKPREYEDLVERGELEQHLVDPFPTRVERGFKIVGYAGLGIGLLLIGLIVYTMLFGYR